MPMRKAASDERMKPSLIEMVKKQTEPYVLTQLGPSTCEVPQGTPRPSLVLLSHTPRPAPPTSRGRALSVGVEGEGKGMAKPAPEKGDGFFSR